MGYDIKKLGTKLKAKFPELAEDAAEIVAKEVFAWTKEEATANGHTVVLGVVAAAEPLILNQIDKIDGKEG